MSQHYCFLFGYIVLLIVDYSAVRFSSSSSLSPYDPPRLDTENDDRSHPGPDTVFRPPWSPHASSRTRRGVVTTTTTTTRRLLAVRVSTATESPTESAAAIDAAVFGGNHGTSTTDATVVAQWAAISHQQWRLVPAVSSPVLDLRLDDTNITVAGRAVPNVTEYILAQTAQALGVATVPEVADHVLFCLPSGGLYRGHSNWTAYTLLGGPYSFYQKSRCTKLSVVMHEVGGSCCCCCSVYLSLPFLLSCSKLTLSFWRVPLDVPFSTI
jgi:hypothetical protein